MDHLKHEGCAKALTASRIARPAIMELMEGLYQADMLDDYWRIDAMRKTLNELEVILIAKVNNKDAVGNAD